MGKVVKQRREAQNENVHKSVPIIFQLVIALIYVEFQRYFLKTMKTLSQMIRQPLDVHKIVMVQQLSHHQAKGHKIILEMVFTVMMML